MDGAAEYAHTCSSSTWRLDAPSLSALRAAANAAGRLRVGGDGSVAAPPRCLVGEAVPEALRRGAPVESGVSAGDEALFTGWFEKQIQLLCGRGADRAGRLRRSDKVSATAVVLFKRFFLSHSVLELDPMTLALCAIFVAGKLEDEFVAAADLAAAVSPDDAAATALAAAVAAAEPAFLAGVRFDLRVAHPHRSLKSLFDACAGAKDPAPDAGALDRAGKGCAIPNFKGSFLGRFLLISADFWTSDHLSERSRSADVFYGPRARGTPTLKRR